MEWRLRTRFSASELIKESGYKQIKPFGVPNGLIKRECFVCRTCPRDGQKPICTSNFALDSVVKLEVGRMSCKDKI